MPKIITCCKQHNLEEEQIRKRIHQITDELEQARIYGRQDQFDELLSQLEETINQLSAYRQKLKVTQKDT